VETRCFLQRLGEERERERGGSSTEDSWKEAQGLHQGFPGQAGRGVITADFAQKKRLSSKKGTLVDRKKGRIKEGGRRIGNPA